MNTANALGWWWVYNLQQETTNAMRNASYDYLDDLYGISQPPSRQQHCLDITNGNLGFALSREYVDKFVPDSVKPEVTNNSITTTTSVISINYKQLHTMHVLLLLYYLLLLLHYYVLHIYKHCWVWFWYAKWYTDTHSHGKAINP